LPPVTRNTVAIFDCPAVTAAIFSSGHLVMGSA
jgi:hypothetical protein